MNSVTFPPLLFKNYIQIYISKQSVCLGSCRLGPIISEDCESVLGRWRLQLWSNALGPICSCGHPEEISTGLRREDTVPSSSDPGRNKRRHKEQKCAFIYYRDDFSFSFLDRLLIYFCLTGPADPERESSRCRIR